MCYSIVSLLNDSVAAPSTAQTSPSVDAGSNASPLSSDYHSYGNDSPLNDLTDISLDDIYNLPGLVDDNLDPFRGLVLPPHTTIDPYPYKAKACYPPSNLLEDSPFVQTMRNYPRNTELYGQPPATLETTGVSLSFPCKVCGDKASGNHFGVLSCEACKSFFRRSIRTEARYSCRAGRCCEIDKQSRNRCQYCRLIKCIKVGMKKEALQEERIPRSAKCRKSAGTSEYGSASNLSGLISGDLVEETPPNSGPSSPSSRTGGSGHQFKMSDVLPDDSNAKNHNPYTSTTNQVIQLDSLLEGIKACAVKLIGWAQLIPAFARLNFENQVRLLKASWCELYVLHLAVHNGSNPDTLVLGGGLTCKPDQIGDPQIRQLITRTTSEVSLWFESLSTEPVELACLKGILLFNPAGPQLSAEVKKEVEVYQEQILGFLEDHSKATHSSISQRFSKLLLRLGSIQSISKEMMQYLEVQQTLGHIQLDSLLVELLDAHN